MANSLPLPTTSWRPYQAHQPLPCTHETNRTTIFSSGCSPCAENKKSSAGPLMCTRGEWAQNRHQPTTHGLAYVQHFFAAGCLRQYRCLLDWNNYTHCVQTRGCTAAVVNKMNFLKTSGWGVGGTNQNKQQNKQRLYSIMIDDRQ